MSDITHEFEGRLNRPVQLKLPEFQRNGRLFHVIYADQFTPSLIARISHTADQIRTLHTAHALMLPQFGDQKVVLYFTQPSTRTFSSFDTAAVRLGLARQAVNDPSVSSEAKGESEYDSIRMHCGNSEAIIMRSKTPKFAECCAYLMNEQISEGRKGVPIISGGAGADEHPTQALLDLYTIQKEFAFTSPRDSGRWTYFDELRKASPDLVKGVQGKTYVFCGDLGRGRTIRSLARLLSQYPRVKMRFVSPDHEVLRLSRDLKTLLLDRGVHITEHSSLSDVIDEADALYMTRVQSEHNKPELSRALTSDTLACVHLNMRLVERMKKHAVILHPLPRNAEVPPEIDHDPRARYFEQAENGQWVRAALLAHIFDVENEIDDQYKKLTRETHDYNEHVL
jgi:aspartate carbamoyltransferase catalytic subunit